MRTLTWRTEEDARAIRKEREAKRARGGHLSWWEQIDGSEYVVDAGDFSAEQLSEIVRRRLPREKQRRKGTAPAQQPSQRTPARDVERAWRQIAAQSRTQAQTLEALAELTAAPERADDLYDAATALRAHATHAERQQRIWRGDAQ
ncbi:hypothetical protein ACWIBQ_03360 [Microbacterium keratanolyticum]